MITLYPFQIPHVEQMVYLLEQYPVVGDISPTGSGKTVASLEIARRIVTKLNPSQRRIIIVCPPSLIAQWKSTAEKYNIQVEVYSLYVLDKIDLSIPFFLIVDECHYFKNVNGRNIKLKYVLRGAHNTILMSATLIDRKDQASNYASLFRTNDFVSRCSAMKIEYPTDVSVQYFHVKCNDDELVDYKAGYKSIMQSGWLQHEGLQYHFPGGLFTKGVRGVHNALFSSLVRIVKEKLSDNSLTKCIAVVHFKHHFTALQEIFPDALVINGTTTLKERNTKLVEFNEPSDKSRLIIVSDQVGGVGIEMDDKDGKFPRQMVVLPTTNAMNFVQLIGRIQRVKTKSNSKVLVIQPQRLKTYFKTQIEKKKACLEAVCNFPEIKFVFDKGHWCSSYEECTKHVTDAITSIVMDYIGVDSCGCLV